MQLILIYVPQKQSSVETKFPSIHRHFCLTSIAWEHGCYEGESSENLISVKIIRNMTRLPYKLTTMILTV